MKNLSDWIFCECVWEEHGQNQDSVFCVKNDICQQRVIALFPHMV